MSNHIKEQKENMLKLLEDTVKQDKALREEFGIGDKFRFIRDRIAALQQQVEDALQQLKVDAVEKDSRLGEDERVIYVYLFNAHGIDVQTWIKMLHPSVYYEYSVNRPIYAEQQHIESVIRSKTNRAQHGYMTIAVKKEFILASGDQAPKDNIGNPLLKIKEGSLKPERFISFVHNGHEYILDENGALEKIK